MELTPKMNVCLILKRINTEKYHCLDEWYCGALHALANRENPDRFSQAAHSLRELMEKLVMRILELKEPRGTRSKETVTKLYEKIDLRWGILPKKRRDEIVDKFHRLRGTLEGIAHHNSRTLGDIAHHNISIQDENKFKQHIEQLEEILSGLDPDIAKAYSEINKILGN